MKVKISFCYVLVLLVVNATFSYGKGDGRGSGDSNYPGISQFNPLMMGGGGISFEDNGRMIYDPDAYDKATTNYSNKTSSQTFTQTDGGNWGSTVRLDKSSDGSLT